MDGEASQKNATGDSSSGGKEGRNPSATMDHSMTVATESEKINVMMCTLAARACLPH